MFCSLFGKIAVELWPNWLLRLTRAYIYRKLYLEILVFSLFLISVARKFMLRHELCFQDYFPVIWSLKSSILGENFAISNRETAGLKFDIFLMPQI